MGPHTCTHPCTPAHRTPAGTCAYPHTPVHTHAHLLIPVHTRAYPRKAVYPSSHSSTHTPTHPCTPEKTSHIPAAAHGLNLINSYQIRVNRKMAEDRKKDRKKDRKIEKGRKEQESAEAIRIIKPRGPKKFWRGLG